MQNIQTLKIEDYSLVAFMQRVIEAVAEGYKIDTESNERAPVSFGGYYFCVLVKPEEALVKEEQPLVKQEEEVPTPVTCKIPEYVPPVQESTSVEEEQSSAGRKGRKPKA